MPQERDKKPIFVAGATGYIGARLVPLLLDAGYPVEAHITNTNGSIGPIVFILHGHIPADLRILISEIHTKVTE